MTASQTPTGDPWATVFRTGRTRAADWVAAFGPASGPILDVGAGDSPWITEMNATGCFAVALDPQYVLRAPRLRDSAHTAALSNGMGDDGSISHALAGVTRPAVAGLAQNLPFRDHAFGTVYMGYCLQHVEDPVSVLWECLRVASPVGRVVIHPVWARGARRREACRQPGASLITGSGTRGRRPSLLLDPALHYSEHSIAAIASALTPSKPIRLAGAVAMRVSIAVLGTTQIGPGAAR